MNPARTAYWDLEPDPTSQAQRQYFERAITTTAKYYPNAALVVRGHVDPQLLYTVTLNAAKKKGLIKFVPDPTDASHQLPVYNGEAFEFEKLGAKKLIQLIDSGVFEPDAGAPVDKSSSPKALLAGTQKLSDGRATAVRDAIIAYAKSHNLKADASMFVAQGMGTREPLVLSSEFVEAKSGQNRRVEFRLIRVDGETKAAAAPK